MRSRHRRIALIAGAVAVASVTATSILLATTGRLPPGGAVTPGTEPQVVTRTASSTTPVCGFPGTLVSKLTADRPSGQPGATLTTWKVGGDGALGALAVAGSTVLVDRDRSDGTSTLLRFGLDGGARGSIEIPFRSGGRWTLADDGSVFVVDGSTRRIVHLGSDGTRLGSFEVPRSAATTGGDDDLTSIVAVPDFRGAPAIIVSEGARAAHVLRADGAEAALLTSLPDAVWGRLGAGGVWGTTVGAAATAIDGVDLSSGGAVLHAVFPSGAVGALGVPSTPAPYRLSSVALGPGGDGFVLSTESGVQWIDRLGVQKGMWRSGQDGFMTALPSSMVAIGDRYWMLVKAGSDATESVATLTSAQLAARMASPVALTTSNESDLAQLGLGIGAVTDAPFNQFDPGTTPAVALRTEPGWGDLRGADRPALDVRYTIAGDPELADPVSSPPRSVAIPWGGGEAALTLPTARPGPYEVSLELVDSASGAVLSGACLRYSIGAAGSELGLGGLAAGDDWGGPAPLRGAQLAAALGIGSYRVQLDFGGLVPDPAASPSALSADWSALPGASESPPDDPFAQLRAAADYAVHHGVRMIVQVGRGGDAEKNAITAGTWAGWVKVIVAEFARQAPGIATWEPYNEPNNVYDSADWYWRTVEIPFADAAHAASPSSYVIAGNTLGFADDWWKAAAADGVCTHVDAVGVHPYTGWNRSWEEEGFEAPGAGYDALSSALGPSCRSLPRWDTESGWTADGATAYWAQASDVARKLLWYDAGGVAGWTYFFSEGGWGENDLSWSLVQYRSFVKPGGLAFAAVSRLLAGRGRAVTVSTGMPFTHVMRVPGDDTMIVAWTDEARLGATLTTDSTAVTVTDQYGAVDPVPVAGGSASVTLTATPRFFRAPAGSSLTLTASEAYGADLLEGRQVTASSTHQGSSAQVITSGTADPFRPWRSGSVAGGPDPAPEVTVPLDAPVTIDRIAVATGNIACCEAGLRGYTVSVEASDGTWHVVAHPHDQFSERTVLFHFAPMQAMAVRVQADWTTIRGVRMLDMNYTGFAGGLPPPFMGLQTATDYVMSVSAVSAWAPATSR